jgi:hypothetical protein
MFHVELSVQADYLLNDRGSTPEKKNVIFPSPR